MFDMNQANAYMQKQTEAGVKLASLNAETAKKIIEYQTAALTEGVNWSIENSKKAQNVKDAGAAKTLVETWASDYQKLAAKQFDDFMAGSKAYSEALSSIFVGAFGSKAVVASK